MIIADGTPQTIFVESNPHQLLYELSTSVRNRVFLREGNEHFWSHWQIVWQKLVAEVRYR